MSNAVVDLVNRTALCFGIAAGAYALAAPGLAPTGPAAVAAPDIEMGIIDERGQFIATDVVPLRLGQEFGWRLRVDDDFIHTWREVMIAPAPPREWVGDGLSVTADGTVGITERSESPRGGLISHGWAVTEGDPAGPYVIHLEVDGELVRTMRFVLR